MYASSLAPQPGQTVAARLPDHETLFGAARSVATMIAESIGAEGAAILIEEDGAWTSLCAVGTVAATDRPPATTFMLPKRDGSPEWRDEGTTHWLVMEQPIGSGGTLVFCARHDKATAATAAAAALLAPALQSFATILSFQRYSERRLASYESALDRSALGIILIARDGSLLFANSNAGAMLDSGDVLRRRGGGIGARDLTDALKLEVAIEHVRNNDSSPVEDPVIALKRRHPLRPLLVCVSPAGDGGGACDAGAILRIFDPDRELQPLLEPVCGYYRLSPVETRLACQIAGGATIEAAAEALRIKPQTARSYLKQIFLKTDTNRQSELVRMLLTSTVRALPAGRFRLV